ncbi:MAG: recombinase family protein [Gaiellaceae bacterium]
MAEKRRRRRADKRRRHDGSSTASRPGSAMPAEQFRLVEDVRRLVYTRQQAAEALGISIATLDRRVVPALNTVKTPWGTRMIPVRELERFLDEHTSIASVEFSPRRRAGRRPMVPPQTIERIRREQAQGRSLSEIARGLTADEVPTVHGGRRWWPSTVRSILLRQEDSPG